MFLWIVLPLVHLDDTEAHLPKKKLFLSHNVKSFEISAEQIIFKHEESSRTIPQVERVIILNPGILILILHLLSFMQLCPPVFESCWTMSSISLGNKHDHLTPDSTFHGYL